ncbi:cytoplasmic protein [Sistotremastrum niveocremeum HHB9708]|uniref:Cytoplasmic protein n=1 Tax=Sistotremastrum niveocremeum HHB9708 TaxID=1314777 RepID=A0A164UVY9_9AGAM|nr:cytoplasmic protein [Sistotremastrum niveocremeum HHB9708]
MASPAPPNLFPDLRCEDVLQFQHSVWYPIFARIAIKAKTIRPLPLEFSQYMHDDRVMVPEGSENILAESYLSDSESASDEHEDQDETRPPHYSFPELDAQIRAVIEEYDAVFPKLNFTSPQDSMWLLPSSTPLKCTSPADVYLILKSSDFVTHDLLASSVFEDCVDFIPEIDSQYELELVLKKWYSMDRSREFRCFVREGRLIGITQRDPVYYEYLTDVSNSNKIRSAILKLWTAEIEPRWPHPDYIVDLLLTRNLEKGHIVDLNPYGPKTDPVLFSFEDLRDLMETSSQELPVFRVIDSPSHPLVNRNAPKHQHNMVPLDALAFGSGQDPKSLSRNLADAIMQSVRSDNV